jgi:hypothetical protein
MPKVAIIFSDYNALEYLPETVAISLNKSKSLK